MNVANWPIVIVESPYAGDIEANLAYAREACANCLTRGEIPYASHLFFPQFLDDLQPVEREIGMTAGYAFWKYASKVVFYIDRGWSNGMVRAHERTIELAINSEIRCL